MIRRRLAHSPLILALGFGGSMAIAFMVTRRYGLPLFAAGLPGLHGALAFRSALKARSLPSVGSRNTALEMICAGWLGMAALAPLIGRLTMFGLLAGWGLAAIATLPLVVTTALNWLQLRRQNHPSGETRTRLLLHSSALLVYGLLVVWMASVVSLWFVLWLSGEPYMGN